MAPLLRHPWLRASARSDFLYLHEVRHLVDHAAHFGPVGQRVRRTDLAQAERPQRAALLRLDPDLRTHERHFQHAATTSAARSPVNAVARPAAAVCAWPNSAITPPR